LLSLRAGKIFVAASALSLHGVKSLANAIACRDFTHLLAAEFLPPRNASGSGMAAEFGDEFPDMFVPQKYLKSVIDINAHCPDI
jgi:hypothetical protein